MACRLGGQSLDGVEVAVADRSQLRQQHLERAEVRQQAKGLGCAASAQEPVELLQDARRRAPLEQAIRYRKQALFWTGPQVASVEASLRWTQLVTLAQWTLYLAREIVTDRPLPWQRQQLRLTPGRVRQGMGGLFVELGTPAVAPQRRGSPPGWPVGRRRRPRTRHGVVRKPRKQRKKHKKRA